MLGGCELILVLSGGNPSELGETLFLYGREGASPNFDFRSSVLGGYSFQGESFWDPALV